MRARPFLTSCVCLLLGSADAGHLFAAEPAEFQFRQLQDGNVAKEGRPVPADAVRVFVYEGEPESVRVLDRQIAVDYGCSGVLFDRATGEVASRFTAVQGWPKVRPAEFPAPENRWRRQRLVGPGLVECYRDTDGKVDHEKAAVATHGGQTWEARQPVRPLWNLGKGLDWKVKREKYGSWTGILEALNDQCHVVRLGPDGKIAQTFTQQDGLAGNIVTHLVAGQGALWAACVDIYDYEKLAWGVGGLSRFRDGKWEQVKEIDGRQVRWVTLMQAVGDDLWLGFLEGEGVVGDKVVYGMGLYPDAYRPKAKAIVIARLRNDQWTTWSRPVLPTTRRMPGVENRDPPPSTEKPIQLACVGNGVMLFTRSLLRSSGNWDVTMGGHLSQLKLDTGAWRLFDTEKDLDADELVDFIADKGEILVTSNVGIHRWDDKAQDWKKLDPHCDLRNPCVSAAATVGNDLWIGYNKPSFGVYGQQGLSRFDETGGRWEHWGPEKIVTASPVQQMVALPSGELWVLFQPRPWLGAAGEYDFYTREQIPRPTGLGSLKNGKWTFLSGVHPNIAAHAMYGRAELLVVGNSLFLATTTGLYRGPGEWKRVVNGWVRALERSKDGKALVFAWHDDSNREPQLRRYDLETGACSFEKMPTESEASNRYGPDAVIPGPNQYSSEALVQGNWVRLPKSDTSKSAWVIGPLESNSNSFLVTETPKAIWIASFGQLIRIDRQALPE